jgi:HTH-type transcriptional regulator / antitoxin HigA
MSTQAPGRPTRTRRARGKASRSKGRGAAPRSGDTGRYMELVHRFHPRPIRSDVEHEAACEIIEPMVGRSDLCDDEEDYLDVLSLLIEHYEEHRHPIPDATPLEMLKHLMDAHGMTQAELGRLLGSSGLASQILRGKRQLSKTHIRKLADRFNVDAGLFL